MPPSSGERLKVFLRDPQTQAMLNNPGFHASMNEVTAGVNALAEQRRVARIIDATMARTPVGPTGITRVV